MDSSLFNVTQKVKGILKEFHGCFPREESEKDIYETMGNVSWTPGFYSGILWLCYEMTRDKEFLVEAKDHFASFKERIDHRLGVDNHDLGFLYSLSCVAQYKITGDIEAKNIAIKAADCLLERFQPKGQFIQAWGELDDPASYRLIVDCLMNIPLLFWANEVTEDNKYYDAAIKHLNSSVKTLIREDGSSFHTYYFNNETGEPTHGETHQGYSDESCWSRGQAWAIYGLALGYHYTKDVTLLPLYYKVTDYYIEHLPSDYVPYWDLIFGDGSGQFRDSSSAAIAICGILQMERYEQNPRYRKCAKDLMERLLDHYAAVDDPKSNGLLKGGFYNKNFSISNECNAWGDYFFVEAVMRNHNPNWSMYW